MPSGSSISVPRAEAEYRGLKHAYPYDLCCGCLHSAASGFREAGNGRSATLMSCGPSPLRVSSVASHKLLPALRLPLRVEERHEKALTSIARRIEFLKRMGAEEYGGLLLRAALHRTEGAEGPRWINILTSVRPTPHIGRPSYTVRPLVESYVDLLEARLQGDIALFLKAVLEQGAISVPRDAHRLLLGQDAISFSQTTESIQWQGPEFHGSEDATRLFNEPWGAVSYFLDTGRPTNLSIPRESLERVGFYSLDQVLWHSILCPGGPTPESTPFRGNGIHVLLPCFHARLAEVLVLGQKVRARLDSRGGTKPETFRLTLRCYGVDRQGLWNIVPPRIWETLPSLEVEHEYETPIRTVSARLYFAHEGDPSATFVDERRGVRAETVLYPQLAVHEAFDPGLRLIDEALRTVKQAHDFEWAVVTLLALPGFQVDWPGYKGHGRQTEGEVDLVAYLPSEKRAILGECTLRGADVGRKISDLAGKGADLSKLLEGWDIRKVLFTTIVHAAIQPPDRQGARDLGVTILPKEGLASLMRAVKAAVPPGTLWDRLEPDLGVDGGYARLSE